MSRRSRRTSYAPIRGQFAGRTFQTMGDYRKALARANRRRRKVSRPIRSRGDLDALSMQEREKRSDALEVLNTMRREGLSLRPALRRFKAENPGSRLGARSALNYIKPALRKRKRQWAPKSYDRLLRIMQFPTRRAVAELETRDFQDGVPNRWVLECREEVPRHRRHLGPSVISRKGRTNWQGVVSICHRPTLPLPFG